MSSISSPHNDRIKLVRLLQRQAKARRSQQRLVLEGVRLVGDALQTGAQPDFVCFTAAAAGQIAALLDHARSTGAPCFEVTEPLMRDMADTETPQGVLAVFPWPDRPLPAAPALIVVADGWRDPGNLGTLIRTSAAAGVDLVALTPGTVDPFNPKTLRAGMGAQFRVPLATFTWDDLHRQWPEHAIFLADAAGTTRYDAVDWTQPAILAIGGEAHGLRDSALTLPHTLIRIPMVIGAESLNAAISASILIYEARRHALHGA